MFRRTGFKKVPGIQSFFQLEPRPRQPRLDCPDWKIDDLRNLLIRQLLHAQVQTDTSAYSQPTLWQTATLAFTVTWFNPQAVIDGTLMLGAFRSSLPADTASLFISGVAAASCLWFFGLTGIFKTCCQNLRPSHMQWINRICGAVIFVYALKLLYTFGQML